MREGLLGRAALCRKQLPIHSRDEPKLAAQLAGLAHMVAPLIAETEIQTIRRSRHYDQPALSPDLQFIGPSGRD
jgi:hypothetical protein